VTSEGTLRCQGGYLAIDSRGYPYPIADEEFQRIYAPGAAEEGNAGLDASMAAEAIRWCLKVEFGIDLPEKAERRLIAYAADGIRKARSFRRGV
jgi:hypothetical protein